MKDEGGRKTSEARSGFPRNVRAVLWCSSRRRKSDYERTRAAESGACDHRGHHAAALFVFTLIMIVRTVTS